MIRKFLSKIFIRLAILNFIYAFNQKQAFMAYYIKLYSVELCKEKKNEMAYIKKAFYRYMR